MKKQILFIICVCIGLSCNAQQGGQVSEKYIIENNEKVITNDMIFRHPGQYKKNKKPLYFINGKEVYTLAYYFDHEDFKKITVLQPAEGKAKYGDKGKNGVIILELNENVKDPLIEITSNRIHYLCKLDQRIADTTLEYFNAVKGNECSTLDLRQPPGEQIIYVGFDNEIKMKHLGMGWDLIYIHVAGAAAFGSGGSRFIRPSKEGTVTLIINVNGKENEFKLKAILLPAVR